ncbi:hypothetical protein [Streptomyces radicis]|uniref:Uncharacterized protein n=1 Tax=Streptomyces radicis TaxID=1750517 RepID=A0A3A9WF55_9ACTN|nr:hypothetical protein [Streptomyces radicis]RKN10933.1 hypothetical protein D7319_07265 [Streptomyces radicis]RKN25196.1 hypothetical protein D7318_08120 [Streptomyces radicis]
MTVARLPADLAALPRLREDDAGQAPPTLLPVTSTSCAAASAALGAARAVAWVADVIGPIRPSD